MLLHLLYYDVLCFIINMLSVLSACHIHLDNPTKEIRSNIFHTCSKMFYGLFVHHYPGLQPATFSRAPSCGEGSSLLSTEGPGSCWIPAAVELAGRLTSQVKL